MIKLRQYLEENKKVYSFNIKVAGCVPECFEADVKKQLADKDVVQFIKMKETPIRPAVEEFPNLANVEVTTFNVVVEYPITPPEIANLLKETGMTEDRFKVVNSQEPSEVDELVKPDQHEGEALLCKKELEDFGDKDIMAGEKFNSNFLKDLEAARKEREKELNNPTDPNVLGAHPKECKEAQTNSAIGSK